MPSKFSFRLYKGFELNKYPDDIALDEDDIIKTRNNKVYCLTFTEFIYNDNVNKPFYEETESFEIFHKEFIKRRFKKNKLKRDEYILRLNEDQVDVAIKKLIKWQNQQAVYPESLKIKRRIKFLQTALGEFNIWYDRNKLKFPEVELIDITKISPANNENPALKPFNYGELREQLKILLKKMGIKEGGTISSSQKQLITNKLVALGYNAKLTSVWSTLYKMGYYSD